MRSTASANGAAFVSCEPMCICTPRTAMPGIRVASSYTRAASAIGMPNFAVFIPVAT